MRTQDVRLLIGIVCLVIFWDMSLNTLLIGAKQLHQPLRLDFVNKGPDLDDRWGTALSNSDGDAVPLNVVRTIRVWSERMPWVHVHFTGPTCLLNCLFGNLPCLRFRQRHLFSLSS
jgi:hypothetical protein